MIYRAEIFLSRGERYGKRLHYRVLAEWVWANFFREWFQRTATVKDGVVASGFRIGPLSVVWMR